MPFAGERDAALATQARADGRRALLTLTPHERHRKLLDDYGAQQRVLRRHAHSACCRHAQR
jgi:hypothetical protein